MTRAWCTGLCALMLSACVPWGQVACIPSSASRLLLEDLAAGQGPSALKRETPAPQRSAVRFEREGRAHSGDLYQPADGAKAGLVLVPGAAEAGKDDPRMVAFAEALARSGFAVLVPDLPNVRAFKLKPSDGRDVADAVDYLLARPALTPQGRVGLAGISYAMGPAVLAALAPDVRDRVRFLMGIGPYYDLINTITFITTGDYREPGGPWRHREPLVYGKWAFVASNLDSFADAQDRETLKAWSERLLADPAAAGEDLTGRLHSDEAKALAALLANRDPEAVPGLVARLPAAVRADLEGLTLANKDLSRLKARVIIVHGTEDAMVPYTEGQALARALPNAHFYLVNGLSHVDLKQPGFWDVWGMGCAINELLAEQTR